MSDYSTSNSADFTSFVLAAVGACLGILFLLVPLCVKFILPPWLRARGYSRIHICLPYSHFVESARWAMDRRGLKVYEIGVAVGPHAYLVPMFRLLFRGNTRSTSSYPGQGFTDSWLPTMTNPSIRKLCSVPLVIDISDRNGESICFADSWDVLTECGFHFDGQVMQRWDQDLGPSVRQAGYYYIFQKKELYRSVQSVNAFFFFWHDVCEWTMGISEYMKAMMYMTPNQVAKAEHRIQDEFDKVSKILDKHDHLGDGTGSSEFGGGDIAFAALVGWVVFPDNYHNGQVNMPDKDALPDGFKALMESVASTRAAEHVRRCYKQRRDVVMLDLSKKTKST